MLDVLAWRKRTLQSSLIIRSMAKILVVEDDPQTAVLVRDWLTAMERHTVEVISNGNEALTALKLYQYDILVLDRQLPGLG